MTKCEDLRTFVEDIGQAACSHRQGKVCPGNMTDALLPAQRGSRRLSKRSVEIGADILRAVTFFLAIAVLHGVIRRPRRCSLKCSLQGRRVGLACATQAICRPKNLECLLCIFNGWCPIAIVAGASQVPGDR